MGPRDPRSSRRASHHTPGLKLTRASPVCGLSKFPLCAKPTVCALVYWLPESWQALTEHLTYCPLMPRNRHALDMCLGPGIPSSGKLLHPLIQKTPPLFIYLTSISVTVIVLGALVPHIPQCPRCHVPSWISPTGLPHRCLSHSLQTCTPSDMRPVSHNSLDI